MRKYSSAMPNEELVQRIQNGGPEADEAFEILLDRLHPKLRNHRYLYGLSDDDKDDVMYGEFWPKVWRGLKRFNYEGEQKFRKWLFKILENAIIDYQRHQTRLHKNLSRISLNENIDGDDDGDTFERIELISYPETDVTDQEHRELVLKIAKQCLRGKMLELLTRRLTGQTLPSDWSRSWIDTNWHRIKRILITEMRKRRVP